MFEDLSQRLQAVFKKLTGKGKLDEKDIDEALRQVRLALLEADVNLKVVKSFLAGIRQRALGAEVLESLTPGQQVIKVVNEELVGVLGGGQSKLALASRPPAVIMLVGLQGSGKTTTVAKLALHLKRSGQRPLMVAADVYRPAAVQQLLTLGKQLDIPVHAEGTAVKPAIICANAVKRAGESGLTAVLVDTAGRLHVEEAMMAELAELKAGLQPSEVLLVADAMTGQDAVRMAEAFHARVGLTGLILTKMDGDARGGAALSIRAVTGVPIKFIGTGEKVEALEPFYPDRMASRILGMGDMLTLIEKAEAALDQEKAKELEKKMRHATFDLEDFLGQLHQVGKMGSLGQLAEMIPGLGRLGKLASAMPDDKQVKKVEAIILSMTPDERHHPNIIDGSRRKRIARGSGVTIQEVNQLLNQFGQVQKLMRQLTSKKRPTLPFLP